MQPYSAGIDASSLNLLQMFGILIGGLALFLLGLEFMTGGFKAIAGARLQALLGMLTASRVRGVLTGAVVTALLNSSTITTVLMVGFVSSGLMSLAQSVPMIMGANIGSTITAQIIAFDVSRLTPFMLAIGFVLHAFGKRELLRQSGRALLGLGLLFLGIELMGDATRPLRTFQPFIDAMRDMDNPLLGILAGALFTAVVQSSAATLAIIIALGAQGLMPLEVGISMILGANVGTCGTALLASIGKPAQALQVGIVHLVFNVLGVLFWVFLIPQMAELVRYVSPSAPQLQGVARLAAETPRQVANAHTIFSVSTTLILIGFTGPIARLAQWIAPTRTSDTRSVAQPLYLDEASLTMPSLGLQRVRLELTRLGYAVLDVVRRGTQMVASGTIEEINLLLDDDKDVDRLAAEILHYIGRLSQVDHSAEEGQRMVAATQVASDLESISGIVGTNLVWASQHRLTHGIDLARLRDDTTAQFSELVMRNLELAIRSIAGAEARDAGDGREAGVESAARETPEGIAKRRAIEAQAAAARQVVLAKLQLAHKDDVQTYRLAMDLIEHGRQVAQFARGIAKTARRMD